MSTRKAETKESVKTLVRRTGRRVPVHPCSTTDALRETLRITVPEKTRTLVGVPTEAPSVLLDFSTQERMLIKYGRIRATNAATRCRRV